MIKNYKKQKFEENSKTAGLDIAIKLVGFITGKEHLHYGYWDGLDVNLQNLGKAQEAYTQYLLSYLPKKKHDQKLKILDIGGGSGEIAKKLTNLGHQVTIIVPSPILAQHAEKNTKGKVKIHLTKFEDYEPDKYSKFDVCLYAESFQYIPTRIALKKASGLLNQNGEIIIADCFRSAQKQTGIFRKPGGGASLLSMDSEIKKQNFNIVAREEITKSVAPSIELEQQFYNTVGFAVKRIIYNLKINRPIMLKIITMIYNLLVSKRRRLRLKNRLFDNTRSSELFMKYNHYMIFKLTNPPKNEF